MPRKLELDFTRGIAVNLMILSHIGVFLFITLRNLGFPSKSNTKSNSIPDILFNLASNTKIFNTVGVLRITYFLYLLG